MTEKNKQKWNEQEAILFNASFKDNIRFGKTDATDEEIANAAKIANAYEFGRARLCCWKS